jgi:uncharacterized membrane protein
MTRSKWLIGLLITSLVINFLAVGFIVGRMSGDRMAMGPDPMLGFPRVLRLIPEERRAELAPIIRPHLQALRPGIRSMRSTRTQLSAALTADPFDRQDLEDALSSFQQHLSESQQASHATFIDFVAALTAEERLLLSQNLHHDPSRHGEKHKRPPPGMHPVPQ